MVDMQDPTAKATIDSLIILRVFLLKVILSNSYKMMNQSNYNYLTHSDKYSMIMAYNTK